MEIMKIIFTIAITMAITITLTMKSISKVEEKPALDFINKANTITKELPFQEMKLMPSKRVSRFIAEDTHRRAADHCKKDNEKCHVHHGHNSTTTCCHKKCMDLTTDKDNCGKCKKKCKYTESCCKGKCVDLAFDKRNCGRCNNRCDHGKHCVHSMCDYP